MGVEILIRRKFVENKADEVASLMVELRSLARAQAGYISSESLQCVDPPEENEYLVRSTWNSAEDWTNWLHSKERIAIQGKIDKITQEHTQYRIYEPLVGGILPEFSNE